ncbi:MAG: cysteine--tRNA ligase [Melioribacteraceae bacterium]|nr:cysteine--tRNA ligase [Melioribacteraceae bacterium]
MQIYNTISRKKEDFVPLNPPNVNMYVCGPTVYDYFHLGNARSFLMADVIRKYLEYKGYKVKFAMNLTDVDDKIIKKANEQNTDTKEITEKYTQAFFDDIKKLRIKKADIYPKATEHMAEITQMIEKLEEKNSAYNVDGNVFFNVSNFQEYGKLSGKKLDELESGARVEINKDKKNPLDFALWKKVKPDEPYWESKWGNGRPGWHIECSAMSQKHLGETIDIHAGGSDLIFPHHENEIAQSEGATGKPFVKYWIHFGFLNIRDEKMSKSLGNFFTTREVLKHYSAESIRHFFNQTHYAGPLNYSEDLLESAQRGLEKINNFVEEIKEGILRNKKDGITPQFDIDRYKFAFENAMDDDFNTPKATAVIFDFVRDANKTIGDKKNEINSEFYITLKNFLKSTADEVLTILNFDEKVIEENNSLQNDLIELLIKLRNEARQEKNFKLGDKIRDELNAMGVQLKDSKEGTSYKIVKVD